MLQEKDTMQASQMGTRLPKWAALPSCIITAKQEDFQQKMQVSQFKIDQRKYIIYSVFSHDINVMGWILAFLFTYFGDWEPYSSQWPIS